jgi:hypothetical protein
MNSVYINLPTALALAAIVGAGAFAAGQSIAPASAPSTALAPSPQFVAPSFDTEVTESESNAPADDQLPPGHPQVAGAGAMFPSSPAEASRLGWTPPARWQLAPNTNTMRIATYTVPHAPGDPSDAELSVTQAGGDVDANAERWIGQFDAAGQRRAKRATRKVGSLEVTIVEVEGAYSGGMGKEPAGAAWALLGAIVSTPGMPHFFKLTGPAKSVLAARAEFDAMIGSLLLR